MCQLRERINLKYYLRFIISNFIAPNNPPISVLLSRSDFATSVRYALPCLFSVENAGKVYFSQTGGVYNVHVSFDKNLATIYFDNGGQTTIQLRQNVITDPNNIEGYGATGQYYLSRSFSIGLAQSDDSIGNFGLQGSRDIQGLWIISLDKNASLDATNAKKP